VQHDIPVRGHKVSGQGQQAGTENFP